MGVASVPVDLRNPGQVFACLGLMEATEILRGPCEGRFAFEGTETVTSFELLDSSAGNPVERILRFLCDCSVVAIAPRGTQLSAAKWGVETERANDGCYPAPAPDTPATLAVRLRHGDFELPLEHWLDGDHSGRDNVKFWAGAGGYPGAALARDAISCLAVDRERLLDTVGDPFSFAAAMDSSFRFDWRRDYIPLDAGFSPNEQPAIRMVGYPVVELLAALGLQHARPARVNKREKLDYRYHVSRLSLPTVLVRAVLGGGEIGLPTRHFRMRLGWPGKKGQARCIVDAEEEFL